MLLLDTNVILYLAFEPWRLSGAARQAIERAVLSRERLFAATVTLIEIAMLHFKGRVSPVPTLADFLAKVEAEYAFIPPTALIAVRSFEFDNAYLNDPADRQIGATALVHGLVLVTADEKIRASGQVPCIW